MSFIVDLGVIVILSLIFGGFGGFIYFYIKRVKQKKKIIEEIEKQKEKNPQMKFIIRGEEVELTTNENK